MNLESVTKLELELLTDESNYLLADSYNISNT